MKRIEVWEKLFKYIRKNIFNINNKGINNMRTRSIFYGYFDFPPVADIEQWEEKLKSWSKLLQAFNMCKKCNIKIIAYIHFSSWQGDHGKVHFEDSIKENTIKIEIEIYEKYYKEKYFNPFWFYYNKYSTEVQNSTEAAILAIKKLVYIAQKHIEFLNQENCYPEVENFLMKEEIKEV